MNRWLLIRRMRWPAFLILFGITALLNQWRILAFHRSWPLYIILAGVMLLAERTALPADPPLPPPPLSPTPFSGQPYGWTPVQPPSSAAEDKPSGEKGRA